MSAESQPEVEFGSRPLRDRIGVWAWIGGMLLFGVSLPMLVSDELRQALGELEIQLPLLTQLSLRLGSCLGSMPGMVTWCVTVVLMGIPGFLIHNVHLSRIYLLGGFVSLVLMMVLAGAVRLSVNDVLHALDEQPSNAAPAAPPERR